MSIRTERPEQIPAPSVEPPEPAPTLQEERRLRRVVERAAFEWRSTFDAIRWPVVLVGLDGRVQRLNRAARDLLGRDYREIIGQPVDEIGSGQPWTAMAALAHQVLASLTPEVCEATDENGEKTWEVEAIHSLASAEGDAKVIVQARDITKTARLQESLRHSETMAALGAVVGGVAHEVRNPLFGMSAVLDAFESRFGDRPEYRPYLPLLRTEIGRITELVQDLLDYGKPARFEKTPQSMAAAVDGAVDLCRSLAERQGVVIVRRPAADGRVLLDLHQFTRALKNVIENAVQHSPSGGRVTIETAPVIVERSPWIRISVRDQGPGFAPDDLRQVLEPFFSRRSGGTGLGLAIVSRVVDGHGGRLQVANHSQGGAVVDIELPCLVKAEPR